MAPAPRASRRRRAVRLGWLAAIAVAAIVTAGTLRSCSFRDATPGRAGAPGGADPGTTGEGDAAPTARTGADAAATLSAGWEEAAETIVAEVKALLEGRPRAGAFAEAQAEASREDLARYPPEAWRLRKMLLGSEGERARALAALAARPVTDDDLAGLVLRSHRPDDGDVVRLLDAEVAASMPPDVLSRHEEELLQAFASEGNPLVLAVALPALEQLGEGRLTAFLRMQLDGASAPMLPILVGLARDRLGPEALASVGVLVLDAGTSPSAGMVSR